MIYINKKHNELTLETVNKILLRVGNPTTRNFDKQLLKGDYNFDDFNFFDTYNACVAEGQSVVDSMMSSKYQFFQKVTSNINSRMISLFDFRDTNNINIISQSFNNLSDSREYKMALNTNRKRTIELTVQYIVEELCKEFEPIFKLNGSIFADESDKQFISEINSKIRY